jgi:H+/Cl- antiporter ClcA
VFVGLSLVVGVLAGLAVRSGYVPTRSSYLKILGTALTLGSGGSAGREGPTVMVGGAIGVGGHPARPGRVGS